MATKEKKQLTNVIGGAFMPDISESGEITYSGYTFFRIQNNSS